MKVADGTHIGPYEVVGWLGAGGMGEVYRAHDPRLGREVAIKLISEVFATDANRVRRFEQEARAAGQLNHPNVLAVYDVGAYAGAAFIVSELLEGESLRSRLRGGALPPRKAVDYARQTAEGLAAAHDKGIVHRDVKPDNLFITNDGRVKILDFGIAKLTQPSGDTARSIGFSTETADGRVVGTAGYMSPEQVRGEALDARSDIFGIGAIFYEMLTGRPAFTRETGADTMAAILKEDPPQPLPTAVPPALGRIVARCLEKTREARFQSARDLAFGLASLPETAATTPPAPAIAPPALLRRRAWPWVVAGALAFGLALVLLRSAPWRTPWPAPAPLRLSVELGADVSLALDGLPFGPSAILSPDGAVMAFVGQNRAGGTRQIYVRRLDQLDQLRATPLPWTDHPLAPFFSPDGQWIAFFADRKLKKVAVTGGAADTLAEAPNTRGGTWGEDDTIVFSPDRTPGTRLMRVSSAGGKPEPLTSLAEGEVIQVWPQVLPGGRAVLYTGSSIPGTYNDANLMVQMLPGGAHKVVQRGGYHGRYLPSGHLVYIHDGTLYAAPFDLDRLAVTGQAVRALDGVMSNSVTGGADFAVSAGGTLVYLPARSVSPGAPIHWMGHGGQTKPLRDTPANWFNLLFAPDGRRLAMEIREGPTNIWLYELADGRLTNLTSDPVRAVKPVWTPDGSRIVFASARDDKSRLNLYWQRADGAGAQRLTRSKNLQYPASWHPSGKSLAFEEENPQTSFDLMILPMEGDDASGWRPGEPRVFLNTSAEEREPMFSPDGRWLAYQKSETGRSDVYVQRFPGPGPELRISTGGGGKPTWSRTKQELFFGFNGRIMVVPYGVEGDSLRAGKPRLWSEGRYQTRGPNRMFDLHPDGERFAFAPVVQTPVVPNQDHVTVIVNFFEELRRIAPTTR